MTTKCIFAMQVSTLINNTTILTNILSPNLTCDILKGQTGSVRFSTKAVRRRPYSIYMQMGGDWGTGGCDRANSTLMYRIRTCPVESCRVVQASEVFGFGIRFEFKVVWRRCQGSGSGSLAGGVYNNEDTEFIHTIYTIIIYAKVWMFVTQSSLNVSMDLDEMWPRWRL